MSSKLQREIHKAKPFDSIQQEAFLNVIRTADHLMRQFEELLKPFNLSATQYNVLRILRGMSSTSTANGHPNSSCDQSPAASASCQNGGGIPCKMIGEHMLTRDPDITRLLDRLESRSLITRQRDTRDRRIVSTRITPEGLKLLKELDQPVLDFHRRQFVHMPDPKLKDLIDLLESARNVESA
jgi:DNA-binding MarR family transcriptional regulator